MSSQPNTRPRPASNGARRSMLFVLSHVLLSVSLLGFFAVLIAPHFAYAECTASFCPLADTGSDKLKALYSTDQNLVTYLNTLFKMAISVGAILAVLRLLFAGYMYMASDVWTSKEKAKEIFRDVFLGLLLLLSIYIILYQINPNLLNLDMKITAIGDIPKAAPGSPGTTPSTGDQARLDSILRDEDRVRAILKGFGVTTNRNERRCLKVTDIECTNVGLLDTSAITGLQVLKMNCRCTVLVTGGTEWFLHGKGTTHQPRNSVVDISKNDPTLNTYIQNNGGPPVSTAQGNLYTISGLGRFLDETIDGNIPHWHVTF